MTAKKTNGKTAPKKQAVKGKTNGESKVKSRGSKTAQKPRSKLVLPPKKKCSCCGNYFFRKSFGANVNSPDGLHWYTKAHAAAIQLKWKKKNKDKVAKSRAKYLRRIRKENKERRVSA